MKKFLTLFPVGATVSMMECRLIHRMTPDAVPSEPGDPTGRPTSVESPEQRDTRRAAEILQDPKKAAEIKDEEARSQVENAVKIYEANVAHDGEENAGTARETAVADIRSALQKAAERARQTTEKGQKEGAESAENPNAVKIERDLKKGEAYTTSTDGKEYTWPLTLNDAQLTALHNVRKTMTNAPFAPTAANQPIRGVSVEAVNNDQVSTVDAKGQRINWRRAELSADDFVKLHETIAKPTSVNPEQQQKVAKEVAQKQAKQKVDTQNGRLDTGRESPELRELAKAIAELIKTITALINKGKTGPSNTATDKPTDNKIDKNEKPANGSEVGRKVEADRAKLAKENASDKPADIRKKQIDGYKGEKASNEKTIGENKTAIDKATDQSKKWETDVTDNQKKIDDLKKSNTDEKDVNKKRENEATIVRLETEVQKLKDWIEANKKVVTKLGDESKKLDTRNTELTSLVEHTEKMAKIEEFVDKVKELKLVKDLGVTIEFKPEPPVLVLKAKNKADIDSVKKEVDALVTATPGMEVKFESTSDAQ